MINSTYYLLFKYLLFIIIDFFQVNHKSKFITLLDMRHLRLRALFENINFKWNNNKKIVPKCYQMLR